MYIQSEPMYNISMSVYATPYTVQRRLTGPLCPQADGCHTGKMKCLDN